MLIFLAIALLLVLSSPWNVVAFLVLLPLWVLELFAWNRTTKRHRRAVGAETLIGREAVVSLPCNPVGQVRLDVDRSGQVTSRLTVERAETLDLLRRDEPELERALQQAGLKTADNGLQFALRDQSFAGGNQPDGGARDTARVVIPDAELSPIETVAAGYGRLLRAGGGIDIRV